MPGNCAIVPGKSCTKKSSRNNLISISPDIFYYGYISEWVNINNISNRRNIVHWNNICQVKYIYMRQISNLERFNSLHQNPKYTYWLILSTTQVIHRLITSPDGHPSGNGFLKLKHCFSFKIVWTKLKTFNTIHSWSVYLSYYPSIC